MITSELRRCRGPDRPRRSPSGKLLHIIPFISMKIHTTARLEGSVVTGDFEVREKENELYAVLQPVEGVGWLVAKLDPGKVESPAPGQHMPLNYTGLIGTEGNPAQRVPFDFFS